MREEHKEIKRMLKIVRVISYKILKGEELDFQEFNRVIYFISNYADNHHHKKEEEILFDKMIEELGPLAKTIIKSGMLVEHDFGRLYIRDLKVALESLKKGDESSKLDIIANAISYTHLLERHIDKEDKVIYKYAERELSKNTMTILDSECFKYEENNLEEKNKCMAILKKLEKRYSEEGVL